MTKAELIRFLEPFTDDIPIVVAYRQYEGGEPTFMAAKAEYQIANASTISGDLMGPKVLTDGDGFIEIA